MNHDHWNIFDGHSHGKEPNFWQALKVALVIILVLAVLILLI